MRPSSIVAFERVSLFSIALDVPNFAARWRQLAVNGQYGLLVVACVFVIGIQLALTLNASRFGSRVCKWIIVILSSGGIADFLVTGFPAGGTQIWKSFYLLQIVLAAVALVLLFERNARVWFATMAKAASQKAT